ncbi:MAG: hypothetical protein WDZ49_05570 [Litorilinea sp.]
MTQSDISPPDRPPNTETPYSPASPTGTERHIALDSRARLWTLRVVALLMVLQATGLAFATVLYLSQVNWIRERALTGLSATAVDTLLFSILSIPLAFFAGRAVLGLVRVRKGAWLQAMMIQALLLVFALSSYILEAANSLTYWTLVSCIIVVMYLNTHEVRSSFYADALDKNDPTELFGDDDDDDTDRSGDSMRADRAPNIPPRQPFATNSSTNTIPNPGVNDKTP